MNLWREKICIKKATKAIERASRHAGESMGNFCSVGQHNKVNIYLQSSPSHAFPPLFWALSSEQVGCSILYSLVHYTVPVLYKLSPFIQDQWSQCKSPSHWLDFRYWFINWCYIGSSRNVEAKHIYRKSLAKEWTHSGISRKFFTSNIFQNIRLANTF
jgi:hypothetical protein